MKILNSDLQHARRRPRYSGVTETEASFVHLAYGVAQAPTPATLSLNLSFHPVLGGNDFLSGLERQWFPWLRFSWCVSALMRLGICLHCIRFHLISSPLSLTQMISILPLLSSLSVGERAYASLFGILARAQAPFSKHLMSSAVPGLWSPALSFIYCIFSGGELNATASQADT